MPPSQLDGREPAEVTEYEYERGRLVRAVTTRESRYTEQDVGELIALAVYREGLCPKCGRSVEVCTSHEATGPQFSASYTVCRSTLAILEEERGMTDGGKKARPNAPAYLWSTTIRKG